VSELVATIVSHDQRDLLGECLAALARDGVPALVCENVPTWDFFRCSMNASVKVHSWIRRSAYSSCWRTS